MSMVMIIQRFYSHCKYFMRLINSAVKITFLETLIKIYNLLHNKNRKFVFLLFLNYKGNNYKELERLHSLPAYFEGVGIMQ